MDQFRFRRFRPATRQDIALMRDSKPDAYESIGNVTSLCNQHLEAAAFIDFSPSPWEGEEGEVLHWTAAKVGQLGLQYLLSSVGEMRYRNQKRLEKIQSQEEELRRLRDLEESQEMKLKHLKRQREDLETILTSHHQVLQHLHPDLASKIIK
eukprot:g6478.t1